jgi:hypothetical protein
MYVLCCTSTIQTFGKGSIKRQFAVPSVIINIHTHQEVITETEAHDTFRGSTAGEAYVAATGIMSYVE